MKCFGEKGKGKMKKFIAVVCLIALISGCSPNYNAEREFWKAERLLAQIKRTDIEQKGVQILNPVIAAFQKVAETYPHSPKASESMFVISNLKIRQKNYEDAREVLRKIVQNFSNFRDSAVEARDGIAKLYEAEKNWPKAEEAYWEVADYHPNHIKGLYAPIHVMVHYKRLKDTAGQTKAFERAKLYYEEKAEQLGPIQAAAAVKNYEALAYLAYGDWQEARTRWLAIAKNFPESPFAPMSLLAAAELSARQEDFGTAKTAYERYFSQYLHHPLVNKAMVQFGLLYMSKKDYAKARAWFTKAAEKTKEPGDAAQFKLLIANTFRVEGKWDQAEKLYDEIQTRYPDSSAALQVPLLLYQHLETTGDKEKAKLLLDQAIQQYETMQTDPSNPQMAALAQRLQNAAYAELGEWASVMENFDRSLASESAPERRGSWLFLKALTAETRIKDLKQAAALYEQFLKEFPNHPLTNTAQERVKKLVKPVE